MKEQYYSDASIEQQAQVFLEKLMPFRARHNYQLDPRTAALLIIDPQKFFFDKTSHAYIPSSNAILPRIIKLQNYCLQNNIKVIHTRHLDIQTGANMMRKWWGNNILELNSPCSAIVPEIADPSSMVVIKNQYDSFYNSELDAILQANGIKQLVIAGVMTHLCCETTARTAFTRGYEVFFSIDGTATYNREFHLGSLINLAHGFAVPLLIAEIIKQLEGKV